MYLLFRYLHFIAIIGLAGALIIENMAISRRITLEDARNLAKVDAVLGISAAGVLVFGLILWFGVGKPAGFYNSNPVFHAKMALFIGVALLSIYPTVFFLKARKHKSENIDVPGPVIWLLRIELIVLAIIPVLAVLMARGVGIQPG